jgi:hypothetical protein
MDLVATASQTIHLSQATVSNKGAGDRGPPGVVLVENSTVNGVGCGPPTKPTA